MDKKLLILVSLCAMVLLVLGSFTNVVGMNTAYATITNKSTVDDNEEIITFISGSSDGAHVIKKGFIRDIEITAGGGGTGLEIKGWKRNSTESFFYTGIEYIHASRFIGFFTGYKYRPVRGIAFGNIEWSW